MEKQVVEQKAVNSAQRRKPRREAAAMKAEKAQAVGSLKRCFDKP